MLDNADGGSGGPLAAHRIRVVGGMDVREDWLTVVKTIDARTRADRSISTGG
jgi:hypothetical protein